MSVESAPWKDLVAPVPQPLEPSAEAVFRLSFMERARRVIAIGALGAMAVSAATFAALHPKEAAEDAARVVAESVYYGTPLGDAAQSFTHIVEQAAGWDHPTETTFQILESKDHIKKRNALATNFLFTGFREMKGQQIAEQIATATKHEYPTRFQQNGNQAITPDSMAQQLIASIEEHPLDTPTIGFTGHSMGGLVLIETLDRIHQLGYKLPKVAFIDFLSTPSGIQTARFGGVADFFMKSGIGGGATGEYTTDFFRQWDGQRFNPLMLGHDLAQAAEDLPQGASFNLTDSQMNVLDSIDSVQGLMAKLMPLRGLVSPDTKVRYYGPVNADTDSVVDDHTAYLQIAFAFKKVLGIDVSYIGWGSGHADTNFPESPIASQKLTNGMTPPLSMIQEIRHQLVG